MSHSPDSIKEELKAYILQHFLQGKQIKDVTDSTPLISAGLLDSISTMQLVGHIEQTYHIEFEAHEVDRDNFENLTTMASFISKKL